MENTQQDNKNKPRTIGSAASKYAGYNFDIAQNRRFEGFENDSKKIINNRNMKRPTRGKTSFWTQFFPFLIAIIAGFVLALVVFFIISSNSCSSSASADIISMYSSFHPLF